MNEMNMNVSLPNNSEEQPPEFSPLLVVSDGNSEQTIRKRKKNVGNPSKISLLESELEAQRTESQSQQAKIEAQQARIDALEENLKKMGTATPPLETDGRRLTPDTFSFMAISPLCSIPMIWAMVIFFTQILIFSLVAIDIIEPDTYNPLGIPANVDFSVRITQFIAIVIAVATQDDIRTAAMLAFDGYKSDYFDPYFGDGTVSFSRWICSIVTRFLEGGLGLTVTVLLVLQAETVVDLLLNFTAMEFVSQLDEVTFFLGQQGFVGKANQIQAKKVSETVYDTKGTSTRRTSRLILLLIILALCLTGFGMVVHRQTSALYLCKVIHVQFSDSLVPAMAAFSGIYDRQLPSYSILPQTVTYVERGSGRAKFAHCTDMASWTFVFDDEGVGIETINPCDWKAKSSETISYDITSTASSEWVVRNDERECPIEYFRLSCYDCQNHDPECNGRGICENNVCRCNEGAYGLRCEFPTPCVTLAIDDRSDEFQGTREWSEQYQTMHFDPTDPEATMLQVYDRPAYISEYKEGKFDIVMYTGRRWVVTSSALLGLEKNGTVNSTSPEQVLVDYFQSFHAQLSKYDAAFISQPMDVDTPTDAATPVGLKWFRVKASNAGGPQGMPAVDSNRPMDTVLLCATCDNSTNPCRFEGLCSLNGTCQCTTGSLGDVCQVPPLGNGRCDDRIFNTAEFSYDGGDCCPQTCVSTAENICGKDQTGYTDVGYFFCHEPKNAWMENSKPVTSISGRKGRSGTSVAISSTGTVLAVGEPASNLVRVFDNDGSQWIQRGRGLEGPAGFGERIAMSSGLSNVVSTPSVPSPLVLGVGFEGGVRVFYCLAPGCSQVGEDIMVEVGATLAIPTFAVSDNGEVLAVTDWSRNRVLVYKYIWAYHHLLGVWEIYAEGTISSFIPLERVDQGDVRLPIVPGLYLSLSRSGDLVAVGTQGDGSGSQLLRVQVYSLYSSSGGRITWIPRGREVSSDNHDFTPSPPPVQSVSLSDDGMVLAVGSQYSASGNSEVVGGVQVYRWEEEDWKKCGGLLVGTDKEGLLGLSLDLSSDGSIVALGPHADVASIYTFQWNGTYYVRRGDSIRGGVSSSLSLSENGLVLAVGLPKFSEGNAGGITSIYSLPTGCPSGWSLFRVSLTLDNCGDAGLIRWDVYNAASGDIMLKGGNYTGEEFTTFASEVCLDMQHDCFMFAIFYSGSCGIKPPGGYRIVVDGKQEVEGGASWESGLTRHSFGKCEEICPEGSQHFQAVFRVISGGGLYGLHWHLGDWNRSIAEGGPYGGRYSDQQHAAIEEFCIPALTSCSTLSLSGWPACSVDTLSDEPQVNYTILLDGQIAGNGNSQKVGCAWRSQILLGECDSAVVTGNSPLQCGTDFVPLIVHAWSNDTDVSNSGGNSWGWTVRSCFGDLILKPETVDRGETCVPSDGCSYLLALWGNVGVSVGYNVTLDGELVTTGKSGVETGEKGAQAWEASHPVGVGGCTCPPNTQAQFAASENRTRVALDSVIRYYFFSSVTLKEPSIDEIEGVLAETDRFYRLELSFTFSNFVAFDTAYVNTTLYQPSAGEEWFQPNIQVTFNASATFIGRAPSISELFEVMVSANYVDYVQGYVWHAKPTWIDNSRNTFYFVQWADFDARKGSETDWGGPVVSSVSTAQPTVRRTLPPSAANRTLPPTRSNGP